jgi:hypothetical protein
MVVGDRHRRTGFGQLTRGGETGGARPDDQNLGPTAQNREGEQRFTTPDSRVDRAADLAGAEVVDADVARDARPVSPAPQAIRVERGRRERGIGVQCAGEADEVGHTPLHQIGGDLGRADPSGHADRQAERAVAGRDVTQEALLPLAHLDDPLPRLVVAGGDVEEVQVIEAQPADEVEGHVRVEATFDALQGGEPDAERDVGNPFPYGGENEVEEERGVGELVGAVVVERREELVHQVSVARVDRQDVHARRDTPRGGVGERCDQFVDLGRLERTRHFATGDRTRDRRRRHARMPADRTLRGSPAVIQFASHQRALVVHPPDEIGQRRDAGIVVCPELVGATLAVGADLGGFGED